LRHCHRSQAPGVRTNLGPNELTALDAAGWNLTAKGLALEAIPEPGSLPPPRGLDRHQRDPAAPFVPLM
jgi:hypothetical protein